MDKYRDHPDGLTILFIDLNDFKSINDNLGHKEGDRVLVNVATILKDSVRQEDDHVVRMGGDEFMVILNGSAAKDAVAVMDRITDRAAKTFLSNGLALSMAIGMAVWDKSESMESLIEKADRNMYEIKRRSKSGMGR